MKDVGEIYKESIKVDTLIDGEEINDLHDVSVDILTYGEDIMVTKPPHYQSKNGLEVIDVIETFTEDLTGYEAVETGNILKYICRWKKKNGLQDLNKAKWYLERLINNLEKEQMKNEK